MVRVLHEKKSKHSIEEHPGHTFNAHSWDSIRRNCDKEQAVEKSTVRRYAVRRRGEVGRCGEDEEAFPKNNAGAFYHSKYSRKNKSETETIRTF